MKLKPEDLIALRDAIGYLEDEHRQAEKWGDICKQEDLAPVIAGLYRIYILAK